VALVVRKVSSCYILKNDTEQPPLVTIATWFGVVGFSSGWKNQQFWKCKPA